MAGGDLGPLKPRRPRMESVFLPYGSSARISSQSVGHIGKSGKVCFAWRRRTVALPLPSGMKAWQSTSFDEGGQSALPSGMRTASVQCGDDVYTWDADLLLPVTRPASYGLDALPSTVAQRLASFTACSVAPSGLSEPGWWRPSPSSQLHPL